MVRSRVDEVSVTGRNTQGVTFAKPDDGDRIIAVARNTERELDGDDEPAAPADQAQDAVALSEDDESEDQA